MTPDGIPALKLDVASLRGVVRDSSDLEKLRRLEQALEELRHLRTLRDTIQNSLELFRE